MQKVIRDGKVAVLYTTDYGAGWYSCHQQEELLFHPELVDRVERKKHNEITEEMISEILGVDVERCPYIGSVEDLGIFWVPLGVCFRISEYDGLESVHLLEEEDWITA